MIIGHPTASIDRRNIKLSKSEKIELARISALKKKIFEFNVKYKTPDDEFTKILQSEGVFLARGSDSHSAKELQSYCVNNVKYS